MDEHLHPSPFVGADQFIVAKIYSIHQNQLMPSFTANLGTL